MVSKTNLRKKRRRKEVEVQNQLLVGRFRMQKVSLEGARMTMMMRIALEKMKILWLSL